jgi:hypothetical protein
MMGGSNLNSFLDPIARVWGQNVPDILATKRKPKKMKQRILKTKKHGVRNPV